QILEERLDLSKVKKAIEITQKHIKRKLEANEKQVCEVILDSLITAQEAGTFWEIDIYLE
ncbi:MAG: hypothetical protein HUJ75_00020, partial [Parasporobacterium sp.]|nr:hypothetical protein [Parasporobacterium sp.]